MNFTKQQYIFLFIASTIIIGDFVVASGAGDHPTPCFEQIFGIWINAGITQSILSWSFLAGLFLLAVTRLKVSIKGFVIIMLFIMVPFLVDLMHFFCVLMMFND